MLQIISGKFFNSGGNVTELASRGVLYSNLRTAFPIWTSIASLEPVHSSNDTVGTYVVD